jgi:hypothetical protein
MPKCSAHFPAEFASALIDMANANRKIMDKTIDAIGQLVAENDVVFGIWRDENGPQGVGFHVIKGAECVQQIVHTRHPQGLRISAIPCIDGTQAAAVERRLGAFDLHGGGRI